MSVEENKKISHRINEEAWNQGNLAVMDEVVAADYVDHTAPPGLPGGREGYKQFVALYRNAFPDARLTVEDQIAEGDKIVTRWTATGTHNGDLLGIPATGKSVNITGISIARIVGGKIVESWNSFDQLGMLQQLGVVPAP